MQVVADSRQPGSTVDPRIYVPEMSIFVSMAAEIIVRLEVVDLKLRSESLESLGYWSFLSYLSFFFYGVL